jgi:hypothetical protein
MDAIVKIIVNPNAVKTLNFKVEYGVKRCAYIKIIITNANEIYSMLTEIKKQFPIKYHFNLEFNWKNVPESIKTDKKVKDELIKIFGIKSDYEPETTNNIIVQDDQKKDVSSRYEKLASIVKHYVDRHGSAPNFENRFNEKGKKKIINYIKTVLGMHKLTDDEVMQVCELLVI